MESKKVSRLLVDQDNIREQELQDVDKVVPQNSQRLDVPIPAEYLFSYEEDGKTFTGYKGQYAIDLLNKTFGDNWLTEEEILKQEVLKGGWLVSMKLRLSLPTDRQTFGYGACYAKKADTAYKGAKTSAFKNACRWLGIGRELYLQVDESELVSEVTIEETPDNDGANSLANQIDNATTIKELNALEDAVKSTTGKKVQEILFKKFNERKIQLIDKK